MADVQLAFPGQQRQGQGMLVIIRDQPSLDGIGNGFPPLVVLVKDMPPVNTAVFVDHQHRRIEMGQRSGYEDRLCSGGLHRRRYRYGAGHFSPYSAGYPLW